MRIHFVRPRFKSDIENVLLYFANECCKIQVTDCASYKDKLNNAIRLFPGNSTLKQKTIDNWRTEISALCSFYIEDKTANVTQTSKLAYFLNENQDLTQFFKFIMLSFQFPGGHIKNVDNIELIRHMSPNEWDVANTTREHYCIYRLMLSTNEKTLYILRNPVSLYKNELIDATPRNGMEVSFNASQFNPEPLLVWQD